ncbi:MAG: hypothetical protein LIO63_06015 [Akkermansia sp.]|nr:hypothetical protein [Akkermansia sp.]
MPSPLIAKPRLKTMHRRREAIIRMRGFSESNGVIEGGPPQGELETTACLPPP